MMLIETLMEEVKPIVSEKFEFEKQIKSIVIAFFGIFALPGFQHNEKNDWVSIAKPFHR